MLHTYLGNLILVMHTLVFKFHSRHFKSINVVFFYLTRIDFCQGKIFWLLRSVHGRKGTICVVPIFKNGTEDAKKRGTLNNSFKVNELVAVKR